MDIISDNTLDNLERAANTPIVSHAQWVDKEWAFKHYGSMAEATFVELASPNNVSQLIARLREAEQKLEVFEQLEEPVLLGHWHHGCGSVVSGTVRVASSDFDTDPTKEFQNDFWDWTCRAMNALLNFKRDQKKQEEERN